MAGLDGLGKENLKTVLEIKNAIADTKSAIASTNKEFKAMGLAATNISSEMGKVTSAANQFAQLQDQAAKSSKATTESIKQETKQLGIVRSLNIEINELAAKSLSATDAQSKIYKTQAQQLSSVRDNAQSLATEFGKLAKSSADIDNRTLWFTALSDVAKDIPGLRMLSGPFEAAASASRETVISNAKASDIKERLSKLTKEELKTGKGLTKERIKSLNLEDITQGKSGGHALKLLSNAKEQAKTQSVGFSGMKAGAKALGPAMKAAFGPLAIITTVIAAIKAIVKMMGAASAITTKFSNSMLISKDASRELYQQTFKVKENYNGIAIAAGETTITQEGLLKTMDAINHKLGFQLNILEDFGDEMGVNVAEAAMLQQNFGFSAEAASMLFLESVKIGKPLKEMTKEMFGQLGYLSSQEGLTANITGLIEEAAKVSGNLKANFGDSTAAIAQGIFNAKRLGFELKSMEGVSSSLLDFQSSIENEMKAEILLGRDLNLEKAREYALMGKTGLLMEEISAQAGSQEDFLKMNIIQRKALAAAVGMEVNELADMYSKKAKADALAEKSLKLQNELTKKGITLQTDKDGNILNSLAEIRIASEAVGKSEAEIREILGGQVYMRKQEESASQKFNKAMAHAKEAFAEFIGDGSPLEALADILTGLTESVLFAGYKEAGAQKKAKEQTETLLNDKNISKEQKEKIKEKSAIAQQDTTGFWDRIGDQIVGQVVMGPGMGSVYAAVKGAKRDTEINMARADIAKQSEFVDKPVDKAEDFIIRPGQKALKFNRGDVVVGGTNLGGGGGGNTEQLLNRILSAIENGGDVYMDGNKVGKSLALATSNMG